MANITANQDIVTANGLCIARKGDEGTALQGARPYSDAYEGWVLVRFNGRQRAYWCEKAKIQFERGVDASTYTAVITDKSDAQELTLPTQAGACAYHFGKNLRLCRQARKMTQAELGQQMARYGLKAAQATICYRESRPYGPNGKFVDAAAKVLKVPVWVFFVDMTDCDVFSKARRFLSQLSSSVCEVKDGRVS